MDRTDCYVYDPDYYKLKEKYECLQKVILGYADAGMHTRPIEVLAITMRELIKLAKGDEL